jgi:formyltetrahydrofolate deformylase
VVLRLPEVDPKRGHGRSSEVNRPHYVNEDLDEVPIIEQAVERVDHSLTAEHLTTLGNDIETVVLNRAVQWHAESRIFEFGNRTVVLR